MSSPSTVTSLEAASAVLSKKHETLRAGSEPAASVVRGVNQDLLSEITDNFHAEHGAQRAAVETRYTAEPAPEAFQPDDEGQASKGPPELDDRPSFQRRSITTVRAVAAAPPTKQMSDATDAFFKKHEELRTTGPVVAQAGGNKDLLSEITDNFQKEHAAQRATVETRYTNNNLSTSSEGPQLTQVSPLSTISKPTLSKVPEAAVGDRPNIGRSSLGTPQNAEAQRQLAVASDALAAKHEELRSNTAAAARSGGVNHDLLSEVTDQFLREHTIHRAAIEMRYSGPPEGSPFAAAPVQDASAPTGSGAIRRASMGSVGMTSSGNLAPVAEKKEKKEKKQGFFKKLGQLFASGTTAEQGEASPSKSFPPARGFGRQSLQAQYAMNDIASKSRQLTARSSLDPSAVAAAAAVNNTSRVQSGAPQDMLGALVDDWHAHKAALDAAGNTGLSTEAPPTHGGMLKQSEHAELRY